MQPVTCNTTPRVTEPPYQYDNQSSRYNLRSLKQSSEHAIRDYKQLEAYAIGTSTPPPSANQNTDSTNASASRCHNQTVQNQTVEKNDGLLPDDPITNAIDHYVSTGDTSSLIPLVRNPPSWSEVHESLRKYYTAASYQNHSYESIKHYSSLHQVISWRTMFLTQFPVKETVESICRVIEYFRDNLQQKTPQSPLVIAGIASGNAIYERAIMEYFRKKSGETPEPPVDGLIQLSTNLLMHCSDHTSSTMRCYQSSPMMPIENLDFQEAVHTIAQLQPKAGILPFVSWIPIGKRGWFDSLVQHPSVIGFVHLKDFWACPSSSLKFLTLKTPPPEGSQNRHLIEPGTEFWSSSWDILGWGANDKLQDGWCKKIRLSTTLEVQYPRSDFGYLELPDHLLYTDEFLKKAFSPLELNPNQHSDSGSDTDSN